MKDLGKLNYFLGISFQQDQELGTITLSQGKYIQEKLEEFGFQNLKLVATPMELAIALTIQMIHLSMPW